MRHILLSSQSFKCHRQVAAVSWTDIQLAQNSDLGKISAQTSPAHYLPARILLTTVPALHLSYLLVQSFNQKFGMPVGMLRVEHNVTETPHMFQKRSDLTTEVPTTAVVGKLAAAYRSSSITDIWHSCPLRTLQN